MADNPVRRFCPYCAAFGKRYTVWTAHAGGLRICEGTRNIKHDIDMLWGVYRYDVSTRSLPYAPHEFTMERAVFTDDGIMYDGAAIRPGMFEATMEAMDDEVAAGVFDPSSWAGSFPRRSAELLTEMEEAVEEELDLPPPLIGIITAYLWVLRILPN